MSGKVDLRPEDINEAASPFIAEFWSRQKLAKLGYVEPFDQLDCLTAEALLTIDAEIDAIKSEEMEKLAKKTGPRKR